MQEVHESIWEKATALAHKFYRIPFSSVRFKHQEIQDAIRIVLSGNAVDGPYVDRAQDAFSSWAKRQAVGTNSGEAAIYAALASCKNGEVILPSYACGSILYAVKRAGAKPVYADVNDQYNMQPEHVEEKQTPRTVAVVVPSLYGLPAALQDIKKTLGDGVRLVDDAAQCMGARHRGRLVGTFGEAGVISFASKTITAPGGGMLLSSNNDLCDNAKAMEAEKTGSVLYRALDMMARYRYRKKMLPLLTVKHFVEQAVKKKKQRTYARISNLDALFAFKQRHDIEGINQARKNNAKILAEELEAVVKVPEENREHVYSKFVIQLPFKTPGGAHKSADMTRFVRLMAKQGVECEWGYTPLHRRFGGGKNLENTEKLSATSIAIPNHADLDPGQVADVAAAVKHVLRQIRPVS